MKKIELSAPVAGRFVLAAVSGGADSVALLALLKEHADTMKITLHAAHFEHGIRGAESREDAAFVEELCRKWAIPLHMGSADVPALARTRGVGLEEAARDARYAFLRQVRQEIGADCIALAHHLDDQAETVLMHLLRGAGLHGAAGMKTSEGDLFRPLLGVRKAELVEWLTDRGIDWREDATNRIGDTPRNRLRLEVMPLIEAIYPGGVKALGRFAELAECEDGYMADAAEALIEQLAKKTPVGWRLTYQADVPEALLRRVLKRLGGRSMSAEDCLAAAALYRIPKGKAMLGCGLIAEKTEGRLYLLDGRKSFCGESVFLPEGGSVVIEGLGRISAEPCENEPVRDDPFCQVMDGDALRGAYVRTRQAGDYIVPLGMAGRQKLSDYFVNRHVDRPLRDCTPLLAKENEVLWAVGVGLSETAKLKKGSRAVRVRFEKDE